MKRACVSTWYTGLNPSSVVCGYSFKLWTSSFNRSIFGVFGVLMICHSHCTVLNTSTHDGICSFCNVQNVDTDQSFASCSAPTTQATILLALVTAGVMTRKGFAVFCRKHAQEDALSLGFDDMLMLSLVKTKAVVVEHLSYHSNHLFDYLSSLQSRHPIWPWDHVPSPW